MLSPRLQGSRRRLSSLSSLSSHIFATNGQSRRAQRTPGAPYPRFPGKFRGSCEPHAPFLKERRTRGSVWGRVQEIRGISLVFLEIWITTDLHSCARRTEP